MNGLRAIVMVGLMLRMGSALSANDDVQLHVYPDVSSAPATLLIRTMVAPNDDNRAVSIVLDSADYYSSSTVQLEGAQSPRLRIVMFRDVPGGVYEVWSYVYDQRDHIRASARTTVTVFPR